MKSLLAFTLFALCFSVQFHAQNSNESTVHAVGAELAKQAAARSFKKLAIFDFTEDYSPTPFSISFTEELRIHMVLGNGELIIIDRASTDRVIEEQRLSTNPLFDENSAASLGKLISADAIVIGSITNQQGKRRLVAKMVSVETSAVIGGFVGWIESESQISNNSDSNSKVSEAQKVPRLRSFHAEATVGGLFVNQTIAPGVSIVLSRMTYKGENHTSRFDKGNRGILIGFGYYAGIPASPNHDYILGHRSMDHWGNGVYLNSVEVQQDGYFLMDPNRDVLASTSNPEQTSLFDFYTCKGVRVDRLRLDASWRYALPVGPVRVYAETGLAWVKQIDKTDYTSGLFYIENGSILDVQWAGNAVPAELPNLIELKGAVGAEWKRWGIHLEGAVTTRNKNYMSPLDMFHHPQMTNWSVVQSNMLNSGVAEISINSASQSWYYWVSSIVQLRYQL